MSYPTEFVGTKAPDFTLKDENGNSISLSDLTQDHNVMLAFYPANFTLVCTKQLCNYRDNLKDFSKFDIQVVGISKNGQSSHALFSKTYEFPFPLLSDPGHKVAKKYHCSSAWMFGGVSRAVFLINKRREIVFYYVEPTVITRRKAGELVAIFETLRKEKLL